jgi:hypothetical protein
MRTGILGLVSLATLASAQAGLVFETDFNAGIPAEFSGAGFSASVEGYAGLGIGGNDFSVNYLRNDSSSAKTVLTLTGLAPHTSVSLSFLAAIIDSWDGTAGAGTCCNPDFLNVAVGDGGPTATIFSDTFNNVWGFGFGASDNQGYPRGANEIVAPAPTPAGHLAVNSTYPDSAYDMGLDPTFASIPHTGATLVVEWWADGGGWQAGFDESFAIENVKVWTDAVSTPDAGVGLLGFGAAASLLGVLARRRTA